MIEPARKSQNANFSVIGGKSMQTGGGRIDLGINEPFGFTHTDAGPGSVIVIGDSTGSVTAQVLTGKGLAATAYNTGTSYTNTVLNDLLRNPVSIDTINYSASNTTQFSQSYQYAGVNLGGSVQVRPINSSFTMSKRNTQQNSLLLTALWPEGLVLGPSSCLIQTVTNSVVTMTFQLVSVMEL